MLAEERMWAAPDTQAIAVHLERLSWDRREWWAAARHRTRGGSSGKLV